MKITEFCELYENEFTSKIALIAERWEEQKNKNDFLGTPLMGAVTLVDALDGDGLNDQISKEVFDGFKNLMKEKADSNDEIRQLFKEYMSDKSSFFGIVNKIKGQIGENQFIEAAKKLGENAQLAPLGNQEGWDVLIKSGDEYIQVKMYQDASSIIEKMVEVNEKLENGEIQGIGGELVKHISFAVPKDLRDEIIRKIKENGNLDFVEIHPIAIGNAKDVHEALVSAADLSINLQQWLIGVSIMGLLTCALNALSGRRINEVVEQTFNSTALSAAGSLTSHSVELVLHSLSKTVVPVCLVTVPVGMFTREILKRIISARKELASWLETSNERIQQQINALIAC